MKKSMRIISAIILLFVCLVTINKTALASEKAEKSRVIAIVFDNSGSMYVGGNQAWCRATYAMEVFAAMLNEGDTLLIYPMHPIEVGGTEYTMEKPFRVTDSSQSSQIRDIFTKKASGTPIESVDNAVEGLSGIRADKKYMIVLTDGDSFYLDGKELNLRETKNQLDVRFQYATEKNLSVMYLGIGSNVVMPDTEESDLFVKKQAKNSEDALSALTEMCNLIFGRDSLPKNHISGKTIDFDISMKKVIVFVQGENVSDLKVTGSYGPMGTETSRSSTKYGTAGCGNYNSVPDASLQGMMVTYADCAPGTYEIEYSGTATSIEVYYEPDADLDFVFTDAVGNDVDPQALYEGSYKVSFGMKDAKTGKLIASDLLGNPHYEGYYSVSGKRVQITHEGYSGEVPVTLNMNDKFEATLTVTYLSGYSIEKDTSDFGWPEGGIQVVAKPAGDLVLEITGGAESCSLQYLEESEPYIAKVYYRGNQLTGEELKSVELKWDPETSNAAIVKEFSDDHYKLFLEYKNKDNPQTTVCGECSVFIYAFYTEKGSTESQTQTPISYNIKDNFSQLQLNVLAPQNYIVISELGESEAITATLTFKGEKLGPEEFDKVKFEVDAGGIEYEIKPDRNNSSCEIRLLPTEGIKEDDYKIKVSAVYTDGIGRETAAEDTANVTLSDTPLWLKWLIGLLLLLLLIIIILIILHIRVFPKKVHVNKRDSVMIFDGEDETKSTTFDAKMEKGQMVLFSKYAGSKTGLMMDVTKGKESYLRKSNVRRSADVKSASVRKYGTGTIQEASIGSIRYTLNEDTGKLERTPKNDKPFPLKHGMPVTFSGTMLNGGIQKPFTVTTKLNYKKK